MIFAGPDFVKVHRVKKQLLFSAAIFAKQKTNTLSRKDHQIVKSIEEVSMQYLIPFAVVSVMALYVLIIASCLCYIGRHGHRVS
jgi:hypothetical protein